MTLSPRQQAILKVIVSEYVVTGTPVGSATVLRLGGLGVSSATIRNDMAALEESGYIAHPHTSAGRVPSDLGYRYYIEALMDESDLATPEKMKIRHQFHQVELDPDEWSHLAAAILARSVQNAALVTRPHAHTVRLKQAHFVGIHERLLLLVLVFLEGGVKQQIFPLEEIVSPSELTRL
ncbi:MAG TPA: heat-inducible transcriptional repressor HrcA, partial [Dehalococcoidia bacterium]|nr:heat-inducible transcriptional repressor HrcA [Dehalococcoidia bacterium]